MKRSSTRYEYQLSPDGCFYISETAVVVLPGYSLKIPLDEDKKKDVFVVVPPKQWKVRNPSTIQEREIEKQRERFV